MRQPGADFRPVSVGRARLATRGSREEINKNLTDRRFVTAVAPLADAKVDGKPRATLEAANLGHTHLIITTLPVVYALDPRC